MSTFWQDLRYGLRLLVRDRSFSLTAVLTLAVCIGANAAMFSVVRSVLLEPLPFPNSERVVLLYNSYPNAGAPRAGTAVPDYVDRQEGVPALSEVALFRREGTTFGEAGSVERLNVIRATPSFFRVVPVAPIRGRVFDEGDGKVGQHQKVLLSHAFWQRQGAREDIVGTSIRLNGQPYEVVGVLPASFSFLQNDIDLFTPAAFAPVEFGDDRRHSNNWQMVGRIAHDSSLGLVQEQIEAIRRRNDERFPQFKQLLADAGFNVVVVPLQDDLVRDIKASLYLLWGAVGFVLLLGCVNLANLMLVRSAGRAREMATRHAIGGGVGRLARQLLTETTLLSAVGGAAGVLLAWWGTRSIAALQLDQLPRGYEIALDPAALAFTLLLTLGVGLALGLAPTFGLRRMNLNVALREEVRGGTSGRRAQQARRLLAMAQVAIALVLLIGAGLLLASFRAVRTMDFGFAPDQVMTATLNLPGAAYGTAAARSGFAARALEGLRALPGVVNAGATTALPFSGNLSANLIMGEGHVREPGESLVAPMQVIATDGYLEAMQIQVVRGRAFNASDTAEAPRVALVDERLAERFWPGQDPVGRRLYRPSDPSDLTKITPDTPYFNVVGVVREIVVMNPRTDFTPVGAYYFPAAQVGPGTLIFTVRTSGDSATLASDIRRVIGGLDPGLPVYRIQSMDTWIDDALVGRRAPMLLAAGFSGVALLLAAIGIYGVLAYGVAERRRELGVRMALGGSGGSVFRLVLQDGLTIVAAGLVLGLIGAGLVGQTMQSLLYGVGPLNPVVIGVVTMVLAAVALIASGIPAIRASRINPAVVLAK